MQSIPDDAWFPEIAIHLGLISNVRFSGKPHLCVKGSSQISVAWAHGNIENHATLNTAVVQVIVKRSRYRESVHTIRRV